MKLGVAIEAAITGDDDQVLAGYRRWVQKVTTPDLFVLWRRVYAAPRLTSRLMDGLKDTTPVVYLESRHHGQAQPSGPLDPAEVDVLNQFAADIHAADRAVIVRFDHEMNGKWPPWRCAPEVYKARFRQVAGIITGIAPKARVHWCPTLHSRSNYETAPDYYPGDAHVSLAGWDRYDLGKRRPLDRAWGQSLRHLRRITARPALVGEFATPRDRRGRRARWLRSLDQVEGVWGAIYFDIDMTRHGQTRDWRLNRPMRRVYRRLLR